MSFVWIMLGATCGGIIGAVGMAYWLGSRMFRNL